MRIGKSHFIALLIFLVVVGAISYQKWTTSKADERARQQMMMPTVVELGEVVEEAVYNKSESAGRIQAKDSVEVVARINGWLEKRFFTEGEYVKKGQVLFQIEPKEYSIVVAQAEAAARQANATLVNAEKELKRAEELVKNDYVSKSYYDNALATRDQSKAAYEMRQAELDNAKRNLGYTKVVSPIEGKIGQIYITEGNLVNTQTGPLATIVSTDPVYAYYNLKSHEYIKFKKLSSGKLNTNDVKIELRLADGEMYPYSGKIEFVDNKVDETAGTIAMRASFENPDNLLVPGDYVTVVSTVTKPNVYTLVPQVAVLKGIDNSYVYMIDDENKAYIQPVTTGIQIGDKWEVLSGLKKGDKVIVSGLGNMRPGASVKVNEVAQETTKDGSEK